MHHIRRRHHNRSLQDQDPRRDQGLESRCVCLSTFFFLDLFHALDDLTLLLSASCMMVRLMSVLLGFKMPSPKPSSYSHPSSSPPFFLPLVLHSSLKSSDPKTTTPCSGSSTNSSSAWKLQSPLHPETFLPKSSSFARATSPHERSTPSFSTLSMSSKSSSPRTTSPVRTCSLTSTPRSRR